MFRRNYLTLLLAAVLLTGSVASFAQTGMARGVVVLKKADGTTQPLADVVIEVYRTDIRGKLPEAKTNSKGEFTILGFLPGATYALAVSAPNITGNAFGGIKAGDEKLTLTVGEGKGNRLTEDEVRQMIANVKPTGELTAEQKKEQAEYEKKVAEITEQNKKTENIIKIVNSSLKEGRELTQAKNYTAAIAKFEEGINADPDFAGSASVLLNLKASALIQRATDKSNETIKADPSVRSQALISIKKDYEDAVVALNRSLELMKTANVTDAKSKKDFDEVRYNNLERRKEAFRLMARTGADRTRGKEAVVAYQEYIDATTDAKVKAAAQASLVNSLMEAQESELAVTEAEKLLAQDPNNVDALAVAGLSLVNIGYANSDKNKLQQGANYLQKYTEVAPADHQFVADAKSLIEVLKKEQNVAPQKGRKKN